MRVLIVEDEGAIRDIAAELLTEVGYEVVTASSGSEAAYLLKRPEGVHLLLTDMKLRGWIDGATVAELARLRNPRMPIVVMSGLTGGLVDRLDELTPPVGFLPKPFSLEQLVLALRLAIEDSRAPPGAP